ncbi:hypothetical protein COCMIDRAFT_96576 [Bipolaris oryzae ATCC 44560]|uniref:Uncharacterized protein n=1 Tax=Bipolaris oryzae ATCC 44560 TaxID=930090 RepID=W6Z508_COCMI|nr:uncharacterized protein COCMIDRAFT_96576 [Bipolaris oryzae ATCC 44560]EUC45065.1 hypothetical protein COCMIDRAFT_96576 [Bipolaris oryzae ATCC 44560]
MAYEPVGRTDGSRTSIGDDLETRMQYDAGSYSSDPSATGPVHRGVGDQAKGAKGATWSSESISEQWPLQSQKLAPMTPWHGFIMVFDLILASTPIMFISLALIAARLDGTEISDYGSGLKEALLISPTIFPLLFAALMGRFFRHLGLWLAQRGTTLGRLEQLVGCQSVFSALERQISLRSWSIIGIASILVWLLSPVGGQSALRLLDQESGEIHSTGQIRYLSPMEVMKSILTGASSVNNGRSGFTAICLAALLSSSKVKDTPVDLWGNVKLPLYRHIENSTSDEWKTIWNPTGNNITYASLIGIPVVGLPTDGVSTFNIKARQWDITCSSNEGTNDNQTDFKNLYTWQLSYTDKKTPVCQNQTRCNTEMCSGYPCPIRSLSLASNETYFFSVAACDLTLENFEAQVQCTGRACAVQKMRKLPLLDDDYPIGYDTAMRNMFALTQLQQMTSLDNHNTAARVARGSTNMERWMRDPSRFIGLLYNNVNLYELSPQLFGDRLTIGYNTYWQSTYGTASLAGNLPDSVAETGLLRVATPDITATPDVEFVASEASTVTKTKPMYKINWKWFTALMVCSCILLAAAYTGLVLKYITIAPDIIGYASSLTILNPYVPTPTGGTTLHGLQRAALLRDLPVRIGDVSPNEPAGVIALAKADTEQVARLDRQRSYI